jgi:hypothetical protein
LYTTAIVQLANPTSTPLHWLSVVANWPAPVPPRAALTAPDDAVPLFRTLKVMGSLDAPTTPGNAAEVGLMVKLAGESTFTLIGRACTLPPELQVIWSIAIPAFVPLKMNEYTQVCTTGAAAVAAQVVFAATGSGARSGPLLRQDRSLNGPAGVTVTVNGTAWFTRAVAGSIERKAEKVPRAMTVPLRGTAIAPAPVPIVRMPDAPPDAFTAGLRATVIAQDPLVASATGAHVVL